MRNLSLGLVLASFSVGGAAPAETVGRIIIGAGEGSPPQVAVRDGDAPVFDFTAYGASFMGGVRVALGDVNGDGVPDSVTAPAAGTGQRVQVFDGVTGIESWGFYPFTSFHSAGIFVAAGDVNGDGRADVVTGSDADASPNGGPHVKVFDGATHAPIADFLAFDASFRGGVRVAAGDINGDGRADLVLGTGPGAGQVKVLDGNGLALISDFQPFGTGFTGGVFVAAGDVDGDGSAETVVGPDQDPSETRAVVVEGGPHIGINEDDIRARYGPFPEGFTGGVRVGTGDADGDTLADLFFGAGPSPAPNGPLFARGAEPAPVVRRVRGFDQLDLGDLEVFDASFKGGIFVSGAPIPTPEADGAALAAALGLALLARRRGSFAHALD